MYYHVNSKTRYKDNINRSQVNSIGFIWTFWFFLLVNQHKSDPNATTNEFTFILILYCVVLVERQHLFMDITLSTNDLILRQSLLSF